MFPCLFLVVAHFFIVQCMQKTSVTPAEFKDDVCLIFSSVALKELTKKETNNFGLHRIHIIIQFLSILLHNATGYTV
jgi:hypothetical protein